MKINHFVGLAACLGAVFAFAAEQKSFPSYKRIQLSDIFFTEGADCGDFNQDGAPDVVAGPYWYAGPDFSERTEYYPPQPFDPKAYSDNFLTFVDDIDLDGWDDILVIGFPGEAARWYKNPKGKDGHWKAHVAHPIVDNESPTFADITGDGRPELIFHTAGRLGFAEINADDPTQPWAFHPVAEQRDYQRFTHGLGFGDISGDGKADLLMKDGWWEQPAELDASQPWEFHPFEFSSFGGSQMLVMDVDGDGDNDVISSKHAHAYGLAWFEQVIENDAITFKEHLIMGERPEDSPHGVAFSQLHSMALADVDGDGIDDIITGKRFWAHGGKDPGGNDPAVLYCFLTKRDGEHVSFEPHRIDVASGVGTQVVTKDLNGDGTPDIVVGNKKGAFIHVSVPTAKKGAGVAPKSTAPKDATSSAPLGDDDKNGEGVAPKSASGRTLNLDFETNDLRDWELTGDAFVGQPARGDTVHARRADSVSGHRGEHWVGTYEQSGDAPQGTLTSVPFDVTHPFASFLVGGGSHDSTCVEIITGDSGDVIVRCSGKNEEEMRQVVVDLSDYLKKKIRIRIVDASSDGWGHVNFDHFRFHNIPPVSAESETKVNSPDEVLHAGLSPEDATAAITLPDGFSATLYAAEPDVKQPIAMAIDDRGRIWVAEAYEYPRRAPEGQGRDRILIFEDADGDGRFDKRTVFAEGLNLVSGLEVGFGGVWVGASPYLLFIPDRNGDDIPDGAPEVLLDGWGFQDTHETLNAFIWGPDGWLYGCQGLFTHSNVGKPGAAEGAREPINGGVWRYHPTRNVFEVFAHGMSNPWGVDFNDHGDAFCTACVIPHLYHMIPGARYQRQGGTHFNPYTYDDVKTIADHLHYAGNISDHAWWGRDAPVEDASTSAAGGGHAHAGAMIYLGGTWPKEYRNQIFMNNIHGARLNVDILTPSRSGYIGSHGSDFLFANDHASQIVNLRYGPDGQVYLIDWYDMQQCHRGDPSAHDRANGRIYRVAYDGEPPAHVNLKSASDMELVEYQLHENDWYVRHARRQLQERAGAGDLDAAARERLAEIALTHSDETRRLRAMWALHVTGGIDDDLSAALLTDPDEHVRAWVVRLSLDDGATDLAAWLPRFVSLAARDTSPVVRLGLASAAQRIPVEKRWSLLEKLLQRAEDADDHNIPLMIWYAAEPLSEVDAQRALALVMSSDMAIPRVRAYMIRRVASVASPGALAAIVAQLDHADETEKQSVILSNTLQGLEGRPTVAPPTSWKPAFEKFLESPNEEVKTLATALGVKFGDLEAMAAFRHVLQSDAAPLERRRTAMQTLLAARDPNLAPTLLRLLRQPALLEMALTGLAQFDDPTIPAGVFEVYGDLPLRQKRIALSTLSSRGSFAVELLKAVSDGRIPAEDISADLIRQLHNLKNEEVNAWIAEAWGQVRATADEKLKIIEKYRRMLKKPIANHADVALGRAVFAKTCQQCHVLYGVGFKIGPDLTGSNRSDVEYLLSNIVDPGALITKEYQSTVLVLDSGRVVTGVVTAEDDQSVTIVNATETVVVPKPEIEERVLSDVSIMPENQLKQYSDLEFVSLIAYLRGNSQTPLLATKDNVASFFNGDDLTGWRGDGSLWSVENGEIIGKTDGLSHNAFLVSDMTAGDFRLSLDVMLADDNGNSGIQFRSRVLDDGHDVAGYQADIGPGWWGKLYEEHGRGLLWDKSGEEHVRRGEWNTYEISARGDRIQTWINGEPSVDLVDAEGERRGVFALQLHSGEATEVRFRNIELTVPDNAE